MVQVIWIVLAVLVTFTAGYVGYSRYLAQFLELDEDRETPAHKYEDGQEYVPSKKPVLLGHHYSSIAGGAPIVGPITAGAVWGWLPALLWVAIGNPLMGSVHDFVSLSGSLRHEGKSIGYIIGEYIGEGGKNMLLWFAFLTIILVVAVFALVVAIVFNAFPQVTTASLIYIALALVFGVYLYQLNGPFLPGTALFVAGVFAAVWVGIQYPMALFPYVGDGAGYPAGTIVVAEVLGLGDGGWIPGAMMDPDALLVPNIAAWIPVVMLYAGIASALPVWVLLQPRDYLSSFLLYAGVGGALLAVVVGTLLGTAAEPLVVADSLGAFNGFWGVESVFRGGPQQCADDDRQQRTAHARVQQERREVVSRLEQHPHRQRARDAGVQHHDRNPRRGVRHDDRLGVYHRTRYPFPAAEAEHLGDDDGYRAR